MNKKTLKIEEVEILPVSHYKLKFHSSKPKQSKYTRFAKFPIYESGFSRCYQSPKPISKMLKHETKNF